MKKTNQRKIVLMSLGFGFPLFLICFSFSVLKAEIALSQTVASKKISINVKTDNIQEAFNIIEKQANISFTYKKELLSTPVSISLHVKNAPLKAVLEEIRKQTDLDFKEIDENVIAVRYQPHSLGEKQKTPSQNIVKGSVVSGNDNTPLAGISVNVKGTSRTSVTDERGNFTFSDIPGDAVLVFTYIGYEKQEIPVNNREFIQIRLIESYTELEQVVVVGYGTQRRADLTGSIASLKMDEVPTQGTNNVQQALQGRLAGVQVESAGGDPGAGVRIMVRGAGSLNNNNPLYIVDGVQVDNINNLLSDDIASIDVLKDASAAAIYGSRAANGVILVTTKSGKKGDNRIDFNGYFGLQKRANHIDVLNAEEWANVSNAAYDAAGLTRLDLAANPSALGKGTDWQEEIYRTAPMQSYNLSASGGAENYSYSISGGYLGQQGTVKKTSYERYNLRIKSDLKKGRVKFGETVILSNEDYRRMAGGWGGQGGNAVGSALKMIPVFSVYDPTAVGGYGGAYGPVTNVANPVAQLNLEEPTANNVNVVINAFAEVDILDGLKYKYNAGYTRTFDYDYRYTYPYQVGTLFINRESDLYESRGGTNILLQEHTLSYDKNIGKSRLQALAGYTYQESKFRTLNGSKRGMPAGVKVLDAGVNNISSGSNARTNVLESYFGRLVYSYDDRYVFTGTIRRDGSSRFSQQYQYGTFPSIALSWNLSNEDFFKDIKSILSSAKIRTSYGLLGNQEIDDYRYIATIISNANYVIGQNQQLWPGSTQTAFATPDIKWETSKSFNVGMDLGLWEDQLSVSADYFIRTNSDVLLQVPIALSTGASLEPPYRNAGQISNKGFEAVVNYQNVKHDVHFGLSATVTAVSNKVDFLGTGSQQIFGGTPTHAGASATVTQAGFPVGSFYLIKTAGIFQNEAEVQAHSRNGQLIQPTAKPGDIRFEDYNNDGKIDQNDRQFVGSPMPKFSFGFGGNASWRNFDMNVFFQGTYGNEIYNGLRQDLEGMNININYSKTTLNAWTAENPTDFPRAVINDPNLNSQTSDRFIEDGAYIRLKTLQIGYTFTPALLERLKIGKCRLYMSFDNLFTITGYKGFNPDLGRSGSVLDRGVDFGHVAYPLARTSMIGLQASF